MHTIIIHNHDVSNAKTQARQFAGQEVSFLDERMYDDVVPSHDNAVICYDVRKPERFDKFKKKVQPRKVVRIVEPSKVNVLPDPDFEKLDEPEVIIPDDVGSKCPTCGKNFIPKSKIQKYCSPHCRVRK